MHRAKKRIVEELAAALSTWLDNLYAALKEGDEETVDACFEEFRASLTSPTLSAAMTATTSCSRMTPSGAA